jgi:hypothetical protein
MLEENLRKFGTGEYKPQGNKERFELIGICRVKHFYRTAATLYADAFAVDLNLVNDFKAGHRYFAACAAALAGTDQGQDAEKLKGQDRARWRKQALDWLQVDLAANKKLLQQDEPLHRNLVQERLQYWHRNPDLKGLRDAAAIAKLPDEEREACRKLWAEVDTLLRALSTRPKK